MFSINLLRAEPCVTTSFDMRVKRRSIARLLKVAQQPNSLTSRIAALDTGDFKLRHLTTANANMVQRSDEFSYPGSTLVDSAQCCGRSDGMVLLVAVWICNSGCYGVDIVVGGGGGRWHILRKCQQDQERPLNGSSDPCGMHDGSRRI